jgi:hypothetical protein
MVLRLVLWNSRSPDAALACRLLCCSAATGVLVHSLWRGRVLQARHIAAMHAAAAHFADWLRAHAALLHTLQLDLPAHQLGECAHALDVAAAAAAAAVAAVAAEAGTPGSRHAQLPLRAFGCSTRTDERLLAALGSSCQQLTQLQYAFAHDAVTLSGAHACRQALAALTRLRRLTLTDARMAGGASVVEATAPALPGLQLTALRLCSLQRWPTHLHCAPHSLRHLELHLASLGSCGAALQAQPGALPCWDLRALSRLEGLAHLTLGMPTCTQGVSLELPGPLPCLQQLRLVNPPARWVGRRGEQLLELWRRTPQLHVAFEQQQSADVGTAAELLGKLPVTRLCVRASGVPPTMVDSLAQLHSLTHLTLSHSIVHGTPQRLARALAQLPVLQEVCFDALRMRSAQVWVEDLSPLVVGLAHNQSLRRVCLSRLPLSHAAAEALARATQHLTALHLEYTGGLSEAEARQLCRRVQDTGL